MVIQCLKIIADNKLSYFYSARILYFCMKTILFIGQKNLKNRLIKLLFKLDFLV